MSNGAMDFSLSNEQELLRSTLRSFLDSFCTKEWLDDLEVRCGVPSEMIQRI